MIAVFVSFNLPVTSEKEVTVGNGTAELTIASSMPEKVSVLDTDYTGYSIVWSCTDYGFINTQYLWIYTADRNSTLTSEDLQAKVTTLQLDTTSLIDSDQTDCTN